ncbi:FkbM family methyltransferase [Pseudomonadota bacterium]|nr:FkbM family methyltransferase [Pseudomonadota bacterium]
MIKQALLGTIFGSISLAARDKLTLIRSAITANEGTGSLINDQLAGRLVSSLCQSDKIFLDVGAHIGSVISETIKRSKPLKIIAIEAMPDKVAKLRRKFPTVELHEYAVTDKEGEVDFFVNTKQSGYSSLSNPKSKDNIKKIVVQTNLIDNLITSINIDVIKIDIEGAELGALRGATQLIKESQPVIMFESGPEESLGFTKSKMWNFLNDFDYEIFIPCRIAHNGKGLTHDGFIESHVWPRRTTNYFAIPKSRREEIRVKAAKLLKI